MSTCSFCKEPLYISYFDASGFKNVCKFHYKIKIIDDIESSEFVSTLCKKCHNGIMQYMGVAPASLDNVFISFKCTNCNENLGVRRKIESYFKNIKN